MYKHMDGYELMTVMMKIRRCGRVITICFTQTWQTAGQYLPAIRRVRFVYLSGSQQTYWHTDQQDRLLQLAITRKLKISRWGSPGTTVSPWST